jgi:hypothetical protein
MEIVHDKILTWEEIKNQYPDEWVVIGNPIFEGLKILTGTVLAHHHDKRVASMEGGEMRKGFEKFTLVFTGQQQSSYHIGILRTVQKPT